MPLSPGVGAGSTADRLTADRVMAQPPLRSGWVTPTIATHPGTSQRRAALSHSPVPYLPHDVYGGATAPTLSVPPDGYGPRGWLDRSAERSGVPRDETPVSGSCSGSTDLVGILQHERLNNAEHPPSSVEDGGCCCLRRVGSPLGTIVRATREPPDTPALGRAAEPQTLAALTPRCSTSRTRTRTTTRPRPAGDTPLRGDPTAGGRRRTGSPGLRTHREHPTRRPEPRRSQSAATAHPSARRAGQATPGGRTSGTDRTTEHAPRAQRAGPGSQRPAPRLQTLRESLIPHPGILRDDRPRLPHRTRPSNRPITPLQQRQTLVLQSGQPPRDVPDLDPGIPGQRHVLPLLPGHAPMSRDERVTDPRPIDAPRRRSRDRSRSTRCTAVRRSLLAHTRHLIP